MSFGLTSITTFSPTATPCISDVVNNATLSWTLNGFKLSLKELIETILDPVVLIKSLLVKNNVEDTEKVPVKTLTLTLFCSIVVSRTWPVATAAFTPSLKDKIALLL